MHSSELAFALNSLVILPYWSKELSSLHALLLAVLFLSVSVKAQIPMLQALNPIMTFHPYIAFSN